MCIKVFKNFIRICYSKCNCVSASIPPCLCSSKIFFKNPWSWRCLVCASVCSNELEPRSAAVPRHHGRPWRHGGASDRPQSQHDVPRLPARCYARRHRRTHLCRRDHRDLRPWVGHKGNDQNGPYWAIPNGPRKVQNGPNRGAKRSNFNTHHLLIML